MIADMASLAAAAGATGSSVVGMRIIRLSRRRDREQIAMEASKAEAVALAAAADVDPPNFPRFEQYSVAGRFLDTTDQVVWFGYARAMERFAKPLFEWMAAYCPADKVEAIRADIVRCYKIPGADVGAPVGASTWQRQFVIEQLQRPVGSLTTDEIRKAFTAAVALGMMKTQAGNEAMLAALYDRVEVLRREYAACADGSNVDVWVLKNLGDEVEELDAAIGDLTQAARGRPPPRAIRLDTGYKEYG